MNITINSEGQVTIPKHIREALHLKPGSKLTVDVNLHGEVVLRPDTPSPRFTGLPDEYKYFDDFLWRGTTDEFMAYLRDDGPSFFEERRPGEKTFSESALEASAAFARQRDAMAKKDRESSGGVNEPTE